MAQNSLPIKDVTPGAMILIHCHALILMRVALVPLMSQLFQLVIVHGVSAKCLEMFGNGHRVTLSHILASKQILTKSTRNLSSEPAKYYVEELGQRTRECLIINTAIFLHLNAVTFLQDFGLVPRIIDLKISN